MVTKNLTLVILITIGVVSINSTCTKDGVLGCANSVYSFKTGVQAYPDKDSILVGDTIWLEVNIPTKLIDVSTNTLVDFSDAANFGSAISFDMFIGGSISNPGISFAANNFNFFLSKGNAVINGSTERIREYLFIQSNNTYTFKLGIIPKRKGVFGIGFGNAANVYRKSDKCSKAGYEIDFENTIQHLYLYQNNRPGYDINNYENKHLYCFKVF